LLSSIEKTPDKAPPYADKAGHIADIKEETLDTPASPTPRGELAVKPKNSNDASPQDPEARDEDVQPTPPLSTPSSPAANASSSSLAAFFSPLSRQIYFPAIPDLASAYHTTTGRINLTITTYVIL
jgi:hypothetical protein